MARKPTPPAVDAREATHQSIAADIAEETGATLDLGSSPLGGLRAALRWNGGASD